MALEALEQLVRGEKRARAPDIQGAPPMFRRPPWVLGKVKTMTKLEAQSSAQIPNESPIVDVLLGGCIVPIRAQSPCLVHESDMYARKEVCESVCARIFKRICAKKWTCAYLYACVCSRHASNTAHKDPGDAFRSSKVHTEKTSGPLA